MKVLTSESEMFALIKAQRNTEVKIAMKLLEVCPSMGPMVALATAEKLTREEKNGYH